MSLENEDPFTCSTCHRVVGYGLFFKSKPRLRKREMSVACSVGDLRKNSILGACGICQLIVAVLETDARSRGVELSLKDEEYVYTELIPFAEYRTTDTNWARPVSKGSDDGSMDNDNGIFNGVRIVVNGGLRRDPVDWSIQQVARTTSDDLQGLFKVREVNPTKADFDLICGWISTCNGQHNHCLPRRGTDVEHHELLRFIDVQDKCLVNAAEDATYVALSYVWGLDQQIKLTTNTLDALYTKESLGEASELSATIKDAMIICRKIGQRYLWVDALCIVQDSDADKAIQIAQMDRVYKNATLTIVAASGNASEGIHGVRQKRKLSYTKSIQEFEMAIVPAHPMWYLSQALWSTRGWTLQEQVLSRRLLVFTDRFSIFHCQQATYREDIALECKNGTVTTIAEPGFGFKDAMPRVHNALQSTWEPKKHRSSTTWKLVQEDPRSLLCSYQTLAKLYCQRALSNELDVVNAFHGITKFLTPALGDFEAAIPLNHLRYALLWRSDDAFPLERHVTVQLPSWSWAAWKQFREPLKWHTENTHSPGAWILIRPFKYPSATCCELRQIAQSGQLPLERLDSSDIAAHFSPQLLPPPDVELLEQISLSRNQYLVFWTSSAHIAVAREPVAGTTTCFKMAIGEGWGNANLYLDPDWRAKQPDELEFVAIGVSMWNLIIMAIERRNELVASRVQISTSVIRQSDWEAANPVRKCIFLG